MTEKPVWVRVIAAANAFSILKFSVKKFVYVRLPSTLGVEVVPQKFMSVIFELAKKP